MVFNMENKLLTYFAASIILISFVAVKAQPNNEWNNKPDVFQINRLPAHATLMPFADEMSARNGDRTTSPY